MVLAAAAIVAAVAFGWLLGAGAPIEPGTEAADSAGDTTNVETSSTTTTTTSSVPPIRTLAVLDVPLSEAVPGFTDTLMMLTTPSESFNVMRWHPSEPETEVALSVERRGAPVGLDVSGNWFAENLDGDVLIVYPVQDERTGWLDEPEAIGLHVESVAWHDTEPGWLAWMACSRSSSGSATLYTLDIGNQAAEPTPVRSFEQGCFRDLWTNDWDGAGVGLEGWGNGGLLLDVVEEDASDHVLIDIEGTEYPIDPDFSMLADGPDGVSIWRDSQERRIDTPFPNSPDGPRSSPTPILADDERLFGASWSPDGNYLALSLEPGFDRPNGVFRLLDAATGAVMVEVDESEFAVITTAWSHDGRFFIYESVDKGSGSAVLVIYDTATSTATSIPLAEIVDEIRVQ